jgi:hypothetical protein
MDTDGYPPNVFICVHLWLDLNAIIATYGTERSLYPRICQHLVPMGPGTWLLKSHRDLMLVENTVTNV